MSELDKFKRRVIRSVARLMLHEKITDDELWAQMKKETGCDCKQLWERMRSLTVRKLKRQLASDDRVDTIAMLARMSLTDWLLFDLVLVHEKIDFIGKDVFEKSKKDLRVLVNLFELVRMFEIEGLRGNNLADAWTDATVHYNSLGYQCSPMLLQRRWFQLKELTREWFYNFWFKYRGNAKRMSEDVEVQRMMPTPLLAEIARQYPNVIIDPFPEWEKLIEERLVIMPQEFENKMREHMPSRPSNDAEPEIILVEPMVETIDLSVNEQLSEHSDTDIQVDPTMKIKIENPELDIHDDFETCDTEIEDVIQKTFIRGDDVTAMEAEKPALAASSSPGNSNDADQKQSEVIECYKIEQNTSEIIDTGDNDLDSNELLLPQISQVFGNVNIDDESLSQLDSLSHQLSPGKQPSLVIQKNETNEEDCNVIKDVSDNNIEKTHDAHGHNENKVSEDLLPPSSKEVLSAKDCNLPTDTSAVNKIPEASADCLEDSTCMMPLIQSTHSVKYECIVLDDSDKEGQSDETTDISSTIPQLDTIPQNVEEPIQSIDNIEEDTKRIEVDTNELQDLDTFGIIPMDLEFADDGIVLVEDLTSDDDHKAEITNDDHQTVEEETEKFDLKLLMNPVVVVKKLDDVSKLKGGTIDASFHVGTKLLLDCIEEECKAVRSVTDYTEIDLPTKDETIAMCAEQIKEEVLDTECDESDEEIPEFQRVKPSSNLLQKPRSRSYNPIQLCKNPDFNTRLKRLSIGFFGSMRNRQLLKCCKPMTVDVHKSFERKLINGTLYLKINSTDTIVTNNQDVKCEQSSSVLPSAMSVQSLIDCSVPNFLNVKDDNVILTERNKVINLPDITEVRRINRNLLTAEVTPIRVHNESNNTSDELVAAGSVLVSPVNNSGPVGLVSKDEKPIDIQKVASDLLVEVKNEIQNVTVSNEELRTTLENEPESSTAIKLRNTIQEINATEDELIKTSPTQDLQPEVPEKQNVSMEKISTPKFDPKIKKLSYRRPISKLPWLTPRIMTADTLLTMDSLVKMLNLCSDGGTKYTTKNLRRIERKLERAAESSNSNQPSSTALELPKVPMKRKQNKADNSKKTAVKTTENLKKPKIRVRHAVKQRYTNDDYCCWAKERNVKRILRIPKIGSHPCLPNQCECCCINDSFNSSDTHDVSDDKDDTSILRACESIESVVRQTQQVNETAIDSTITKVTDVTEPNCESVANSPISSNATDTLQKTVNDVLEVPVLEVPAQLDVNSDSVPKDQIHIDTVKGEIRVTTGHTTNVINMQGEITVKTCDESDYLDAIPNKTLAKPRKRIIQIPNLKKKPTESVLRTSNNSSNITKRYGTRSKTASRISMVNTSQRHIVVDGCNKVPELLTPQHQPPKIREKHIIQERDRPISLGKNKILLTTVKFPKKNTVSESNLGALPILPSGVKLIMQPDGEIVASLEPGTNLSDKELASLPIILNAVKQQLQNKPFQPTVPDAATHDIVTISDDENSDKPKESPSVVMDDNLIFPQSMSIETRADIGRKHDAQAHIADPSQVDNEQIEQSHVVSPLVEQCLSSEKHACKVPEVPDVQEITPPNGQENAEDSSQLSIDVQAKAPLNVQENSENSSQLSEDNDVQDKSKPNDSQVVVDTVSQSTIGQPQLVAENASISDSNNGTEGTVATASKKTILSDLMEMSGISAEDTIVTNQDNSGENVTQETSPKINIDGASLIHELNPITSFPELKYACEMGGLFFKLDLKTGIIAPINVCIKKQSKSTSVTSSSIAPKSVIDLTDDMDVSSGEEPNVSKFEHLDQVLAHNIYNSLAQKSSRNTKVTPLKLFKSVHSNILPRSASLLKRQNNYYDHDSHANLRKRKVWRNRKNNIEVKIDLLDSDEEPMEEEYLHDSFNDEESSVTNSSDDEPLSKKAIRKMSTIHTEKSSKSLLKPIIIAEEAVIKTGTSVTANDVPPSDAVEEKQIDEAEENLQPKITFLTDHGESENTADDCILGV